jgi:hypothetical protein
VFQKYRNESSSHSSGKNNKQRNEVNRSNNVEEEEPFLNCLTR